MLSSVAVSSTTPFVKYMTDVECMGTGALVIENHRPTFL